MDDAAIQALATDIDPTEHISNMEQLLGKYMTFKRPGDSIRDVNLKFWFYLKFRGLDIAAQRTAIVRAVHVKVASYFPSFDDPFADELIYPED
jgi:hypothetical protein